MRPSQVALNLGTPPGSPPRTSSDFEEVNYPSSSHWSSSQHEEELPLHYMSEEKARRRLRPGAASNGVDVFETDPLYDDEGKDVYNKMRPVKGPTLGGRPRRPSPPPATNLVRRSGCLKQSHLSDVSSIDGILPAKFGAPASSNIHTSFVLDALL